MPVTQSLASWSFVSKLVDLLLKADVLKLVGKAWNAIRTDIQLRSPGGIYEVLAYESTLELLDDKGQRAAYGKREKVRYLRDNVIAYQDQARGDGEILLSYHCGPCRPVDQYRLGHKTYVLISRREVKNKGDTDEFRTEWGIRRGFLRATEQWETHIRHVTRRVEVNVVFPPARPPTQLTLIEHDRQRSQDLRDSVRKLPDGRWQVTWAKATPRLHETYILQWEW